jgi:hypothetical protein
VTLAETVSKTLGFYPQLARSVAQEEFIILKNSNK